VGAAEALGGSQQDRLDNAFRIGADIRIPEADDCPTGSLEIACPTQVRFGLRVLPAVQLDDQPRLPACEIDDERADRELAGEFRPVAMKQVPDRALGIGGAGP
jgi:hypothetical protein